MRRAVIILICALSLVIASAVLAQPPGDPDAARPGEIITGLVEFDGARVYVGPDFAYDIIGQLQKDTSVVVLGRSGDFYYAWTGSQWLQIRYEGQNAWVYARLIRTSIPFNSIPPTGRPLPRNRNGRVPDAFNLSDDVCNTWRGEFSQSGSFMDGDAVITVTYPELPGANIYSVIVIQPSGDRTAFDSTTTTAEILLRRLPRQEGTYTWRVAPYWSNGTERYNWQQICLLQTGGTFTVPVAPTTPRPPRYRYGGPRTPQPTLTPAPLVP